MAATDITHATINEDGDCTCLARIVMNGSDITQSDVTSIGRKIFDLDGLTPTTAIVDDTVAVASVVFDELQTDDRWSGSSGYNFRHVNAGSNFPNGARRYRIVYSFTGSGGEKFPVRFQPRTTESMAG